MLREQIGDAGKAGACRPLIGVGCPGLIEPGSSIDRGAQNRQLGSAAASASSTASCARAGDRRARDRGRDAQRCRDQGLSEMPAIRDVELEVLTIGTGLGNARAITTVPGRRARGAIELPYGRKRRIRHLQIVFCGDEAARPASRPVPTRSRSSSCRSIPLFILPCAHRWRGGSSRSRIITTGRAGSPWQRAQDASVVFEPAGRP